MFRFPNPVDERAARTVAGGVVVLALLFLVTGWAWLLVPLAYGFIARVLAGPRLSPLALLATRVVVPRLPGPARLTPGPPKRFAQGIGAVLSTSALVASVFGANGVSFVLVAAIAVAATLEAVLGFCIGCRVFAGLMRAGVIPERVCAECADLNWLTGASRAA
jgi:Domain of unknown function (DUF4395)